VLVKSGLVGGPIFGQSPRLSIPLLVADVFSGSLYRRFQGHGQVRQIPLRSLDELALDLNRWLEESIDVLNEGGRGVSSK
jgi:hypothetical protein